MDHPRSGLTAAWLLVAILLACASPPRDAQTRPSAPGSANPRVAGSSSSQRVVVISLDGFPHWMLEHSLRHGLMPRLAEIVADGVTADGLVTSFPAKTAVAHAVLWTGTDPSRNGITGNSVHVPPLSTRALGDLASGFQADALRAEPLWSAAARQERRTFVLQATQNHPFEVFVGSDPRFPTTDRNLVLVDGYSAELAPANVLGRVDWQTARWPDLPEHRGTAHYTTDEIGDTELVLLAFDDPKDPVDGLDTLWILPRTGADDPLARLKPRPAESNSREFVGVPVRFGQQQHEVFYRLFSLATDGSSLMLYRSAVDGRHSYPPQRGELFGPFLGRDGGPVYRRGELGERLDQGGDGSAESRYLDTLALAIDGMADDLLSALEQDWDLLIGYLPFPDGPNHLWMGFLAQNASVDAALRAQLEPYLNDAYRLIDNYLGQLYAALAPGTVLVLVSDHGFVATDRLFFPNVVLRRGGLLELNPDGSIDQQHSDAMALGSDGSVFLRERFAGGEPSPGLLERVRHLLLAERDERGMPILTAVRRSHELGLDGPFAGDLYLELQERYYLSSRATGQRTYAAELTPAGNHFGDAAHRSMRGIFVARRKGHQAGASTMDTMHAIDVTPTLSELLDIAAPMHATGRARLDVVSALRD